MAFKRCVLKVALYVNGFGIYQPWTLVNGPVARTLKASCFTQGSGLASGTPAGLTGSVKKNYLEYCIQAWRPYRKKDIDKLERI